MHRLVLIPLLLLIGPPLAQAADGGVRPSARDAAAEVPPSQRQAEAVPGSFLRPAPLGADRSDLTAARGYVLSPRGDGSFVYESPQFSATIAPSGAVTFHDHHVQYSPREVSLSFDLSDELAPGTRHAPEKSKFLAATAQQRAEMGKRAYSAEMQTALDDLPKRLDEVWNDRRYRRRERRRIIFLLWDETASSDAGRSAARVIEQWIRERLPLGSPRAYTDAELQAFERERAGRSPFRPYGSLLQMRAPQP